MRAVPAVEIGDAAWDAYVLGHPDGWWFHTSHWRRYAVAYADGRDASIALLNDDGSICGVCACVVDAVGLESHGGQPAPALLHNADIWCEAEAFTRPIVVAGRPGGARPPAPPGAVLRDWRTRVIDLAADELVLFGALRQSYRQLVRRFEHEGGETRIGATPGLGAVAQAIHDEQAGRQTRSDETWRLMDEWATLGHAFWVLAGRGSDPTDLLGYAYIIAWKGWAYYASGATLEKNVSHALQWAAIRELRRRGVAHYEIGWQGHATDAKGKAIEFFKAGFGGTDWPVLAVESSPTMVH